LSPSSAPSRHSTSRKSSTVRHDIGPQVRAVGLEDGELSSLVDGVLDVDEQAPHIDVFGQNFDATRL
jgi:hypothetical protein